MRNYYKTNVIKWLKNVFEPKPKCPTKGSNYHIIFNHFFILKTIAMKPIYCLMVILWPFLSKGQIVATEEMPSQPALYLENIVPDLTIHQLLNYKDTCASLSNFRGKLIILDFWSVYCKTCIKALPKLDSLQKEFEGKIQILLITHPSGNNFGIASMKQTFARWAKAGLYIPHLPVATSGNESLIELFPHEYIPHYVWIDSRGKLCAITGYNLMNKQMIETLLNDH